METEPKTVVRYDSKKKLLIATTTYPEKDLSLQIGGNTYLAGKVPEYSVDNAVTKDNVPILLEYLKEQFALQNGPYEEAKTQLLGLNPLDDKLCEQLKEVANELKRFQQKEVERVFRKFPAFQELTDKALKKLNLREQIKLREPAVAKLKEQVDEVLKVAEMLAKESK